MYTRPSVADIIDGVIAALNNDVLPDLRSQKAVVSLVMAQSLLEGVKQRVPQEQQLMAAEHNQLTALYREMAETLATTPGAEAGRVRERALRLGAIPDLPVMPNYDDLAAAYRELSQGLVETLEDLDLLIREGSPEAETALTQMRTYLGPRTISEFTTYFVGAGLAGRG